MSLSNKTLFIPLLLVSYEIATYLSNDMYLPALPQMMTDLHISLQQTQLTLTYWFVGSAATPLVVGVLADRFGRRATLLWGGVIYIFATFLCAFAYNVHVLLIGRLIQGAMVPTMFVPAYAIIHESYQHKEAIKILATMGSVSLLAPALGPILGSLILLIATWRWIFIFIIVFALTCILLLYKWMPETLPPEKRARINLRKLCGHYWRIIINPGFMIYMFGLGFVFAGFLMWITAGPLLMMLNFHYTSVEFGVIQAIVFSAYIYGNHHVKVMLEKHEAKRIIDIGLITTLVGGFIMVITALVLPHLFFPFLAGVIIYSYGSALCYAPLNRIAIEMSDEPMGVRIAIFTVFATAFGALGSGMASLYFDGSIKSLAYLITATIVLSCLMIVAAPYACKAVE